MLWRAVGHVIADFRGGATREDTGGNASNKLDSMCVTTRNLGIAGFDPWFGPWTFPLDFQGTDCGDNSLFEKALLRCREAYSLYLELAGCA